jgi:hypothetical protein
MLIKPSILHKKHKRISLSSIRLEQQPFNNPNNKNPNWYRYNGAPKAACRK